MRKIAVRPRGNDRLTGNAGADGFIFADGYGRDKITDFSKTDDLISLGSDLWGGAVMTATQVLASFALIRNGNVVLDFGTDELTLIGVSATTGLADNILIA